VFLRKGEYQHDKKTKAFVGPYYRGGGAVRRRGAGGGVAAVPGAGGGPAHPGRGGPAADGQIQL